MRERLDFGDRAEIAVEGNSVALDYAWSWLERIGLSVGTPGPETQVLLSAGLTRAPSATGPTEHLARAVSPPVRITLWDFQVGLPGTGAQASAVSGVSWVMGRADDPPLVLPADVPEKWCGLFAATLAISALIEIELNGEPVRRSFDVSAADVLRAFADQNSGNHAEVVSGWRRNGRFAVEHGGIYPQGFFECKDGYVAIVGRSRKDWLAIREAIDWPEWAKDSKFSDPFMLAEDSDEVDRLLTEALRQFGRDELLERALQTGATIAPVYTPEEVRTRDIVRPDFFDSQGHPSLPFRISR